MKTILIRFLSDSMCFFFVADAVMQAAVNGDMETFHCAHFTKNGHNYSMFQIKFPAKANFFVCRRWDTLNSSNERRKNETREIIGTIFKVNQNQITSKFRNLNHSIARFDLFFVI